MKKKMKIKFFNLYDTFTEEEKRQFRLFISSPLFNQGRKYSKILNLIESDRSVLFEFRDTNKERTLWNRLSELTKLAERFFVLKASEEETPEYNFLLLSELKKRNLDVYFKKHLLELKSVFNKTLLTNMNIEEYLTVSKKYLEHLKSIPDSKKLAAEFSETNNYKFAMFILELLDYLIQLQDLKLTKSIRYKMFLEEILLAMDFNSILLFIRKTVKDIYPLVAFHYYIYNSFKEPLNHGHYEKAKKIFENELKQIPEEYRMKLYGYMINSNIELVNLQETTIYEELFNVMNRKLSEGLCSDIQDRNFNTNKFRDYILVALSLKKFKWTKNFIDEFGAKLPHEFRDDSILLGKALLMFAKKDYLQSMELLNRLNALNRKNPYIYIDASLLKLKVCFELDEIDECHCELRRLLEFLRPDQKVQDNFMKYTKDFCISYNLLLKFNENPTKKNLIDLEFELSKGKITGRRWIKEKLKELKVN